MTAVASMVKRVPASGTPMKADRTHSCRFGGFASFGNGDASVLLEVAATPEAKARGLMGRTTMPACCGMLFTGLDGGAFWMKGCKIPLDIVFLDNDGTVTRTYGMAADGGVRRYAYGNEKTAIELPYGFCDRYGIARGTTCNWRTW